MMDIPAPPYSLGQAGATHPFCATFLRQAKRLPACSKKETSPPRSSFGHSFSMKSWTSLRKASSSEVKRKSMCGSLRSQLSVVSYQFTVSARRKPTAVTKAMIGALLRARQGWRREQIGKGRWAIGRVNRASPSFHRRFPIASCLCSFQRAGVLFFALGGGEERFLCSGVRFVGGPGAVEAGPGAFQRGEERLLFFDRLLGEERSEHFLGRLFGREDDLGLGDEGDQPVLDCHPRLPDKGLLASMERDTLAVDGLVGTGRGEEVGFGLDSRRAGAGRQVEGGRDAAESVGEGHDRAAVHDAGDGTEVLADVEFRAHAFLGYFYEADA